jgi:3-oxoacyl-[acyl-carrier protein] reductase
MTALSGKTALVTGASRGIGRASALALAKAGAQVLVHYGRGAKEAEAVVAQIRKAGSRADAISADLAVPDGPQRLAKQVRAIVGIELMHRIRKGQFKLGKLRVKNKTASEIWNAVLAA